MRSYLFAVLICLLPSLAWGEARVLVLGDSNTWGSNASGPRHTAAHRWGAVMGLGLEGAVVIEEGRVGRRTDLGAGRPLNNIGRSVKTPLPLVVAQHLPLDLALVMLGTNDLQAGQHREAATIARSAFSLARIILAGGVEQVLVVVPPPLKNPQQGQLAYLFGQAEARSQDLAAAYAHVSQQTGIPYFDAGSVTAADGADGVHLTAKAQHRLGRALVPVTQKLLAAAP